MFLFLIARRPGVHLLHALALLLLWQAALAQPPDNNDLTLGGAIDLTLAGNPELAQFPLRKQAQAGEAKTAALRPALELGAELENFAGSGDYSGSERLEATLLLSSVIELDGKRAARLSLADARMALLESERQIKTLDLLGEVTRRFVQLVYRQERLALAEDARKLARETLDAVSRRLASGAASQVDRLHAETELLQAELTVQSEQSQLRSERMALAVLWGAGQAQFARAQGNLFAFGADADFENLFARAEENPLIQQFASEARLRDAELRLASSRSVADISWALGLRRFQDSGDTGLVAGFSLPLFAGSRGEGERQTASAEREQVALKRDSALLALRAQLFSAYQQRQQAVANCTALQSQIIPRLQKVLAQIQRAYERGRYGYLDLIGARRDLVEARRNLLDNAAAALRLGAEIEQLSAQPLRATRN